MNTSSTTFMFKDSDFLSSDMPLNSCFFPVITASNSNLRFFVVSQKNGEEFSHNIEKYVVGCLVDFHQSQNIGNAAFFDSLRFADSILHFFRNPYKKVQFQFPCKMKLLIILSLAFSVFCSENVFIFRFKEPANSVFVEEVKEEIVSTGGEIRREFNVVFVGFSAYLPTESIGN